MAGVAVNVTFVPLQMSAEGLAPILRLTGRFGLTGTLTGTRILAHTPETASA